MKFRLHVLIVKMIGSDDLKTPFKKMYWILIAFTLSVNLNPSKECEELVDIGCYNNLGGVYKPLNVLIENGRSRSSKYLIKWGDYNNTVSKLLCHCASVAKENDWHVFGVQFFGECWGTKTNFEEFRDESQPKDSCLNGIFKKCKGNFPCVGTSDSIYLYTHRKEVPEKLDGGYTSWSEWSTCPVFCGTGVQERHRLCTNPVPKNGGENCDKLGPSEETQACRNKKCFSSDSTSRQCQVSRGEEFDTIFTIGTYSMKIPFCLEYARGLVKDINHYEISSVVHSAEGLGYPSIGLFFNAYSDATYEFAFIHLASRFNCISLGRRANHRTQIKSYQCDSAYRPGSWIHLNLKVNEDTAELTADGHLLRRWNTLNKNTGVGGVLVKVDTEDYQVNFMELNIQ